MALHNNYLDQTFLVTDPDARIRVPGDLLKFKTYGPGDTLPPGTSVGDFKLIPRNTTVRVDQIEIMPSGSKGKRVFAHALSEDGTITYGWTSSRNFSDKFRNVTLGLVTPEHGAGRYSQTATWSRGDYTGQVSLVLVMDSRLDIEKIAEHTAAPYFDMVRAAAADGITIYLNSGFRSYPEQKYLYENYIAGTPGFNLAAKPGRSNHQNGIAFDIPVAGGAGNPEYDWLAQNGTSHGFLRTVRSEPWHWEYRPDDAASARARGSHKLWS